MPVRGRVRFLAEDIWEAPEDGKIYEVIDGALYVTPPPSWQHQRGLNKPNLRVAGYVYDRGLGEVVTAPVGVVLDEENGVEPDLLYISRERLDIISARGVEGAPDLVVEVLSPSTAHRDRGIKFRDYAAHGVGEYWIVDAEAEVLEQYLPREGGYELVLKSGSGEVASAAVRGFRIPIRAIFDEEENARALGEILR